MLQRMDGAETCSMEAIWTWHTSQQSIRKLIFEYFIACTPEPELEIKKIGFRIRNLHNLFVEYSIDLIIERLLFLMNGYLRTKLTAPLRDG
jgi:hypothetical protein